jgi:Methyl-accepting chemotaxis protein
MELCGSLSLETLGSVLPVFQALFPYDVYLDISDREHFIYVAQPQSFKLDVKVGDDITPGSMAAEMLSTGRPTYARVTQETTLYGVPYIAKGLPLIKENSVIGTMTLAMNVDDLEQMEALSQRLLKFLDQSNIKVQELTSSAEELAATATEMIRQGESTQQESSNMFKSISEVQKIAQQSHVLSINTSIEASRMGQAGRSFLVISQHMLDLAATSLNSSRSINDGLNRFQSDLKTTLDSLTVIDQVAQQQAADISALAEATSQVTGFAEDFGKISLFKFD